MAKGIDYTSPIDLAKAKEIKAAGFDFICRYVVPERYAWKRLTPEETKSASDAGLNILSVYETSAGYMRGGSAQAKIDAPIVKKEMQTVGQPAGSAIYFTADFDVTTSQELDAIERYLRQMTAELPDYAIGVYGEYVVIETMADRKACKHFWQTYAWSGGKRSQYANLYQYKNGDSVAGIQVDLNESFGNEGWWSLRPKQEQKPLPTPQAWCTYDVDGGPAQDAVIMGNQVWIPLRDVNEHLGGAVMWDNQMKHASIVKK